MDTKETKFTPGIEEALREMAQCFEQFQNRLSESQLHFVPARIAGLKDLVLINPKAVEFAAGQVQVLDSWLRLRILTGTTLCGLVCGLIPAEGWSAELPVWSDLLGEPVHISDERVRDANWIMRRWRLAEENIGMVDSVVFLTWCMENDIETNYLRLINALMGTAEPMSIGQLPLTEVVKYGRGF